MPEPQVIEADIGKRLQSREYLGLAGEEADSFVHGEVQDIGDALAVPEHLEGFVAIAASVAVRAAKVHVGEELHLDVLEAAAGAGRAAPGAGVEAEGARRVAARFRFG